MREIGTRFDFKGSACTIERTDGTIQIKADDEPKLRQVQELLRGYLDPAAFQLILTSPRRRAC